MLLVTLYALLTTALSTPQETERREEIQQRQEFRFRQRADAQGEIRYDALIRAKEQLDAKRNLQNKESFDGISDAGIWDWEWLGPGNIGGRIRALLIHPTDPNIMWAGAAGGGIWKSTNGGSWWDPIADFLPSITIASLAMDPTNPLILYAGTGELVGSNGQNETAGSISVPSGAGIFKSTNGGTTWFQLTSTSGSVFTYVSELAHHPAIAGHLLAATFGGIYATTNGGSDWTRILTPSFGEPARDVKYNPTNPATIMAGTTTDAYLSTNGGISWTRQTTGSSGKIEARPGRCEIAFALTSTNTIYVSAGEGDGDMMGTQDTIWRSTNGGIAWYAWENTNADPWSNVIWVSPTDPNLVVWGGFGDLFRSTNAGATFQGVRISDWRCYHEGRDPGDCPGQSAHGDQHVLVSHPGYNGTSNRAVFVGNDGGVQQAGDIRTVSLTSGWSNLANNLGVTQFFGGAAAADGSIIVGGSQDNSTMHYRPASGAQGWTQPITGDGLWTAVDFNNPSRVFFTYPNLFIMRSTNGGSAYNLIVNGLDDTGAARSLWGAPFVMDPNNPSVLVAGGRRIWRTTNSGNSWEQIRSSVTGNPGCSAIEIAKNNTNVIWVGYDNGTVSYTTDLGSSWTNASTPSTGRFVTDIAVNPFAFNEVIVTVGGYSADNVWLSSNAGVTWEDRTGSAPYDLPEVQVGSVRYHPLQPEWIYVGTDLGVFASEDKGLHWSVTPRYASNDGPVNVEVDELFWQGTTYLIAATHGRGMFRCKPLNIVYVDKNYTGPEDGSEFRPFNSVTEAFAAYGPGALISVKGETYDEPPTILNKRGTVRATGGTVQIR
jgi:photosystem II stability/assembly factor-like uncharacterized protein